MKIWSVVGQGNCGKTSIVGYLKAKEYFSSKAEFEGALNDIEKDFLKKGIPFQKNQPYTYFVDKPFEINRKGGNSKITHTDAIGNDIQIVDLGGFEHSKKNKNQLRAINTTNYCLYCIDINSVIKVFESEKNKVLEYFYVCYNKFKENMTLALTKCDKITEEKIKEIYDYIRLYLELSNISINIIPVGIYLNDFDKEAINLRKKSFSWYEGNSLLDIINSSSDVVDNIDYASIGIYIDNYKHSQGNDKKLKIWKCVVYCGSFEAEEEKPVYIGPVLYRGEICYPKVEISEIQNLNYEKIQFCSTGSIVTMNLNNMSLFNKEINKDEVNRCNSNPFIFSKDVKIVSGKVIEFEVLNNLINLSDSNFELYWYNKKIQAKLILKNDRKYLKLNDNVYLPQFNNKLLCDPFIIRRVNFKSDILNDHLVIKILDLYDDVRED